VAAVVAHKQTSVHLGKWAKSWHF